MHIVRLVGIAIVLLACDIGSEKSRGEGQSAPSPENRSPAKSAATNSVILAEAFPGLAAFDRPLLLEPVPEGRDFYVMEQKGRVWKVTGGPKWQRTLLLDIQPKVHSYADAGGGQEEGLLGLAFHPQFRKNGMIFVNYTARLSKQARHSHTVIARYRAKPDGSQIDEGSEERILTIKQPYSNHNGGCIAFGPDDKLYIAMGDGGAAGDPHENGQDLSTLLGALLRIDVDARSNDTSYGIPPDNPFVGRKQARPEIWAYGLRNPWRFSFDRKTGTLWAADVGQNLYEEIDIIKRGGNYGWDAMEGRHCYEPKDGCDKSKYLLPVHEYGHDQGISVTGGFMYRGENLPALAGHYIFGDFGSGRIWALRYDGKKASTRELLNTGKSIASFGQDHHGELYVCAFDGHIYKLQSQGQPEAKAATEPLQAGGE